MEIKSNLFKIIWRIVLLERRMFASHPFIKNLLNCRNSLASTSLEMIYRTQRFSNARTRISKDVFGACHSKKFSVKLPKDNKMLKKKLKITVCDFGILWWNLWYNSFYLIQRRMTQVLINNNNNSTWFANKSNAFTKVLRCTENVSRMIQCMIFSRKSHFCSSTILSSSST